MTAMAHQGEMLIPAFKVNVKSSKFTKQLLTPVMDINEIFRYIEEIYLVKIILVNIHAATELISLHLVMVDRSQVFSRGGTLGQPSPPLKRRSGGITPATFLQLYLIAVGAFQRLFQPGM